MQATNKIRRRKLIVLPDLQKRIIRDMSLIPILALIMGTVIVGVSVRLMLSEVNASGVQLPGLYGFLGSLAGFFFLACYVTLTLAARISNRIAGPIYRLDKVVEQFMQGDTQVRVSFRKDDYLTEIADNVNLLLEVIEKKQHPSVPEDAEEKSPEEVLVSSTTGDA